MRDRRSLQTVALVALFAIVITGCQHTSKGPNSPPSSQPEKKLSTTLLVGWITWDYDGYYKVKAGNGTQEWHAWQHVRWDLTGVPNNSGAAVVTKVTFDGGRQFREDDPQVPPGGAGCDLNDVWDHSDDTWDVNNPLQDELAAQVDKDDQIQVRTAGNYPERSVGYRPIGTNNTARDEHECGHQARKFTQVDPLWQQALDLLIAPQPSKEHREGSTSKTPAGASLSQPVDQLQFDPGSFGAKIAVEVSWSLDVLPDLCKKRQVTTQDIERVREILGQSNSYVDLTDHYGRLPLDVSGDPAPAPGVKGRTGYFTSASGETLGARLYSREIDSLFDLASTAAHESFHIGQIKERGFVLTSAAPFLSLKEYTALKWQAEAAAFDFQAKVLNDLSRVGGAIAACVAQRLAIEGEVLNMQPPEKRRETVTKQLEYDTETVEREWNRYSQGPKDGNVGNRVSSMRNNGAIADAINQFQKWL
jgi:hypothetical protein